MMSQNRRREFLKSSLLATAGAFVPAASGRAEVAAEPIAVKNPFSADPLALRRLTPTVQATRVGLGTGMAGYSRSSELTRLGHDEAVAQVRRCYDSGIRLFDLADLYGTHQIVGEALRDKPRDSYTLITKIWPHDGLDPNEKDADLCVKRFLQEIGTDYIDVVQIHCQSDPQWPTQVAALMEGLEKLKEQGLIRAHGVTTHSLVASQVAAEHPWVDTIHFRINNKDIRMDGTLEENRQAAMLAQKNGKGVIVMKVLGEGQITDPEEQKSTIRAVACHPSTDVMVVALKTQEYIDSFLEKLAEVLKEEEAAQNA